MKLLTLLAAATLLAACSATDPAPSGDTTPTTERLEAISAAVTSWRNASDLQTATTAAETAANLVVGPDGPGYGDRNGDDAVSGATEVGLLPGLDGDPTGLVLEDIGDVSCVDTDVLGGAWDDPAARWQEFADAVATWTPGNNTMPTLASHPMRIVGWATFTQDATLDEAKEYGGHAAIHVDVSRRALADC